MRYAVLVLFLLLCRAALGQSSAGDDYYQQGKNYLVKKQTEKSLKAFDRARTEYLKEKNWERYFVATQTISIYYQDIGKGEEAERILSQAIAAVPGNSADGMIIQAKLHDNLGYTYLNVMGDPDRAIPVYTQSIRFYEQSGKSASSDVAFERSNRAIAYYTKGTYEEAVQDFEKAISLYESDASVEKTTLASTYSSTGSTYLALVKYDQAASYLEKALAILPAVDSPGMTADIHNNLSIALEGMARYREALDHVQKAKAIYEEVYGRDPDHYGQGCINAGKVFSSMGDYLAALQQYQEVLDIYGKTPPGNIQDLMSLMLSVGSASNQLGMRDQARVVYDETLKLIRSQPGDNSLMLADLYAKMAAVSFDDGEYDRSLEFNFKALDIVQSQKLNDPVMLALIDNNVGQAYDMLMELALALEYKNQALEIFRKLHGNDHPDVAMAISNIGLTYEMFEEYDKALEFLNKALEIRIKILGNSHKEVGTTYLNMGVMQLKNGDTDKAIASLEKAVVIYEPFSKFEFKATAFNTLAVAWFQKKDMTKSGQYFQKAIASNVTNFDNANLDAIPQNPEYLDYSELITSFIGKADVSRIKGDLASLTVGMRYLDAADKVLRSTSILMHNPKDRLKLAQLNFFLTEAGMQLADKLMKVSPDEKYMAKAFYFSERNKANELYADVRASRAAVISGIPPKLLARQREIAGLIQSTEQQLASAYAGKDQALITRLKSQLFNWSAESKTIEQDMAKGSQAYASVTGQRSLPGWDEVKATLGPGTALVSYTITDSAKYVLIGTSDRLELRSIDRRIDLEKMVRGFRNQIKFHEPVMTSGKSLSDAIWKPVEDVLSQIAGIENIIIIPDGPLSLLPFEALESKGKYLLERYSLRYNISSSMMLLPATGEIPKKPSLIALAPVFADEETNFVNKSCERFAGAARKTDSTSRSFSTDGTYITPLPATEVEVQEIYRVLSATDPFSKYFLKKDANEELIKKGELARYDYIHFATHGLVNAQYPELSGLLLAQNKQSVEDGILYTGEIFGLKLKAQLVTLSACETALGKRVEGEGVRGLTSAFLLAGARTVVVSLWKVADESTARLMISFYNQLLSGKDKASSLREAKLSLLHDSKYAHPFYWAPFVQIGAK